MRDVVILHGRADEAAARRVEALLGDRAALTCALDAQAPVGAFGQQFTLVAIWSDAARAEGLDQAFAALFAAAPKRSVLVRVNGAARPVSFVQLDAIEAFLTGAQADFASLDRAVNGADLTNEARSAAQWPAGVKKAMPMRRQTRQAMSLAATALVGIAGGALAVASDAATGVAFSSDVQPITALKPRIEAPPVMPAAEDTLSPRVEALLQPARALAATPRVQARFELVQKVAATEVTLNALIPQPAPVKIKPAAEPAEDAVALDAAPAPEAPVAPPAETDGLNAQALADLRDTTAPPL